MFMFILSKVKKLKNIIMRDNKKLKKNIQDR